MSTTLKKIPIYIKNVAQKKIDNLITHRVKKKISDKV